MIEKNKSNKTFDVHLLFIPHDKSIMLLLLLLLLLLLIRQTDCIAQKNIKKSEIVKQKNNIVETVRKKKRLKIIFCYCF
jgi:hypothetical protein